MKSEIDNLINKAEAIASAVRATFGELSVEQLNWKPSPDSWSVGQCLDHLIATNRLELPSIEKALAGKHTRMFWEKMPVLPKFFGNLVIKFVDPANVKKSKSPKPFLPSKSDIRADIIDEYLKTSEETVALMQAGKGEAIDRMIITSPVIRIATYSVADAFKIIVLHDRRHFNQAKRVVEAKGFPA